MGFNWQIVFFSKNDFSMVWFGLVWYLTLWVSYVSYYGLWKMKKIVTQDKETKVKTKMEKMDLLMNGLRWK